MEKYEVKSDDISIDIDGVKTFTPSYDQKPEEVPFTEWFWQKCHIWKYFWPENSVSGTIPAFDTGIWLHLSGHDSTEGI